MKATMDEFVDIKKKLPKDEKQPLRKVKINFQTVNDAGGSPCNVTNNLLDLDFAPIVTSIHD